MRTGNTLFSLPGKWQKCDSNSRRVGECRREQALSFSTNRRWIATFKDGEEEIKDKARSGRPREAVTSEKIAMVEGLVSNNPHILLTMTLCNIRDSAFIRLYPHSQHGN